MSRFLLVARLFGVPVMAAATMSTLRAQEPPRTSRDKSEVDIVARGRIEPKGGVIVVSGPPESLSTVAIVDKLLVHEDDKVAAGQVLAIINGYDMARADLVVAKANLNVARLQRAQVEAGVGKSAEIAAQTNLLAARQAALVKAEKDWQRTKKLVDNHATPIQVLDAQKAALDEATQEVEQSQNTIKSLTEVRPVDDALAAGQVAVSEANVEHAEAAMDRLRVRARQTGTVLSIQTRGGEAIGGDGILRLGDLDHLIVIAEIDETQAGLVRLGAKATITGPLLAEPDQATVTRVGHEIYRQKRPSSDILVGRDARVVEVELTPQKPLPDVIGAEVTVRLTGSSATQ